MSVVFFQALYVSFYRLTCKIASYLSGYLRPIYLDVRHVHRALHIQKFIT